MLTIEEVKKHLRIDGDSEDDTLEKLMQFALSYSRTAVGTGFDGAYSAGGDFASLADILMLTIIEDRFENRGNGEWKADSSTSVLITQLQCITEEGES